MLHTDCMEFMRGQPDKCWDLAIVDPPYGRGEDGGKDRSGGVRQRNGDVISVAGNAYAKKGWDSSPPPAEYFSELRRVSERQIVFGINYFQQWFGPGLIVWDKCNDGSDQSGAEIAACSFTGRTDIFRFMWRGMMQGSGVLSGTTQQGDKSLNEKRIHPTQKPVALYKWLLTRYAKPGWKILDTHGGSGSDCIAVHDVSADWVSQGLPGIDLTWIEKDPDYYAAAVERYTKHAAQLHLFDPEKKDEPENLPLDL